MTIAACYLSSDGVVFGADSTTTIYVSGRGSDAPGSEHHYNYGQKIFQLGENSTLAMTMWGLGSLGEISYRTLIAQFADSLISGDARTVEDVANQWRDFFWVAYSTKYNSDLRLVNELWGKSDRTEQENWILDYLLQTLSGGFCIGGNVAHDRRPQAFEYCYNPRLSGPSEVKPLIVGSPKFWGCPNLVERLLFGIDDSLFSRILNSDKWKGTPEDLFELIEPHCLGQPRDLPIREAIDWVHASIYTTIKTMKFSHMAPICGGPIEIAVITTDRRFRWVRHKGFDAAIGDGSPYDVGHHTR